MSEAEPSAAPGVWSPEGPDLLVHGDCLDLARRLPDGCMRMVYLDPPFNTGRRQERRTIRARSDAGDRAAADAGAPDPAGRRGLAAASAPAPAASHVITAEEVPEGSSSPSAASSSGSLGDGSALVADESRERAATAPMLTRGGFQGRTYRLLVEDVLAYDDEFADYWAFLEPRLVEAWRLLDPEGTLYLHLDAREVHYAKVLLDALVGRERFVNELIWAYDYGAKTRRRWPAKHQTILMYAKDPRRRYFDGAAVDREPYMAPGLVTPEQRERGKLPTDVWWHTIVSPTGREKTGYPTQKPEGILRRMVQASTREGDWVADLFGGSGTTAAVARALGRRAVIADRSPEAVRIMTERLGDERLARLRVTPHRVRPLEPGEPA